MATKKKATKKDKPAQKKASNKEAKKPSIFSLIVDALRKGPKTTDQIAEIIAKNSTKISTAEQAKKTVPVRMYNLKKQGFEIDGSIKEGKFKLVKEPKKK